jgi:hypothetical protein
MRYMDYSHPMDNKTLFFKTSKAGFAVCAVLLGALTGCVGQVDWPSAGVDVPPPATVVVQNDYVYYPNYGIYYNQSRSQYAYQENGTWVSRPAPRGVPVDVLRASPSVEMNFHDSPANHHAAVVQQYPKNWKPSASKQGEKENQNANQYASHGESSGR